MYNCSYITHKHHISAEVPAWEESHQHWQGSSLRSHLHNGQCHIPTNSTNYYLSQCTARSRSELVQTQRVRIRGKEFQELALNVPERATSPSWMVVVLVSGLHSLLLLRYWLGAQPMGCQRDTAHDAHTPNLNHASRSLQPMALDWVHTRLWARDFDLQYRETVLCALW